MVFHTRQEVAVRRKSVLRIFLCAVIMIFPLVSALASGTQEAGSDEPTKKPISVMIYDRGNVPAGEGTIRDNRWTDWIKENAPEELDITFVPIPRGEEQQKLNALFAAGDAPDLIMSFSSFVRNQMYSQGLSLPLDDVIAEHSTYYKELIGENPILARMGRKEDGNIHMIGKIRTISPNRMLLIREDWLDELGLEMPTTTEELFNVAKAFTEQDPNGSGQDDTQGIALAGATDILINNIFGLSDLPAGIRPDGTFGREVEERLAATEFKKRIFDAGLTDPDFITDADGTRAKEAFLRGEVGIYGNWFNQRDYESLRSNVPEAELALLVPLPESEMGQYKQGVNSPAGVNAMIYKNAEHPDAVIQYIDFITHPDTSRILRYGIEGEHWQEGTNGCPEIIDIDKHEQEVQWNRDFNILESSYFYDCELASGLDMSNPVHVEVDELRKQLIAHFADQTTPEPLTVDFNSIPPVPAEMYVMIAPIEQQIEDLWTRAIVSGDRYTPQDAYQETEDLWKRAGGEELDQFYQEWFEENKDDIIYTKDYLNYLD